MTEPRRRPAVLVVDDEPVVLAAVARDLRRGFGERYRIVSVGSGEEGLEVLGELVRRGEQVALLVADQRMPGLSGTDYRVQARELVESNDDAELFLYTGDRHLFADSSLPDYDENAAKLLKQRVLAFLASFT